MTRARSTPYWCLVGAAAIWVGLVFLAPYARQQDWLLGAVLYDGFHRVCHQIPERSFHAFGHPLAVCHRCIGLYFGFLLGLLLLPSLHRLQKMLLARPRLVVVFFVPMLIDVALLPNTYLSRLVSGLVAALPVGLLAWMAVRQLFSEPTSVSLPRREENEPRHA